MVQLMCRCRMIEVECDECDYMYILESGIFFSRRRFFVNAFDFLFHNNHCYF